MSDFIVNFDLLGGLNLVEVEGDGQDRGGR